MLPAKLAFVDLETTGTRFPYDRVIEIGIVRVENNEIVETYNQLLNPQRYLPPEIELLTGITSKDLDNQPTFHDVKDKVYELLKDAVFCAHNARFDYGFIKHEFNREELPFTAKQCCTVKLSRNLFPDERHHNLDAVMNRMQLSCDHRHRAYSDAFLIYQFYQKVQYLFPTERFVSALKVAMNRPSLPSQLKQTDVDNLPELPGVYIFYGQENIPLYVGKSKNIHERVLSHFNADIRSSTEMQMSQQVKNIETITTAGELGALFTESKLIKKLLPLYNRQLRRQTELIGLYRETDSNGYPIVALKTLTKLEPSGLERFIGFFRSRRQAKNYLARMVKEYNLCEKLLGLEKTPGSCFAHRLGICKGACMKKESVVKYLLRFTTAFSGLKVKPWPFNGPIAIEEKNLFTNKLEYFLVDKWCYFGDVHVDEHGNVKDVIKDVEFDLDVYNILRRFFNEEKNLSSIKLLSQLGFKDVAMNL